MPQPPRKEADGPRSGRAVHGPGNEKLELSFPLLYHLPPQSLLLSFNVLTKCLHQHQEKEEEEEEEEAGK